jgi:hypothetical protein
MPRSAERAGRGVSVFASGDRGSERTCDKFLYGFKGGLAPAAAGRRTWPKWGKSRGEARKKRGQCCRRGASREREILLSGEGSHRGGWGFARRLPRGGAPARSAPPPGPRPRTGPHGERAATTRELVNTRTASGHERQGDEAADRTGGKAKGVAAIGLGEKCTPQAPADESFGSLPEPVKSASRPYGMAYGHT